MSNPKLGEPFPAVKEMIQTHLKEYIPSNALWGPEDPLTGLPTYMRKTETVSSYLAGRVVSFSSNTFNVLQLSFNRINNSLNHLAEGNIELCSIMTNRYDSVCVILILFCFRFLNDIARHKIELLCRELATSYDKRYAVPSDWNPTLPAHASVPLPDSVVPSKEFLDWVDIHVGSGTRKGLFETNEAGRGKRSVTVSRDDLIKLWKDNGGSICRVFGIEGIKITETTVYC